MIIEYHRPDTIEEALELLQRKEPITVPMGGGSALNAPSDDEVAVVDLQSLGLDMVKRKGKTLMVGATVTLETLLASPALPEALSKTIRHEATTNLRQVGTIAGTLVAADGRSAFTTTLLALDPQLTWLPGDENQWPKWFAPAPRDPS